jgi:hypothetical protein
VYSTLLELVANNEAISSICAATGMRVYRAAKGSENGFLNGTPIDEFGTDLKQFKHFSECVQREDKWGYEFTEEEIKFISI